MNELNGGRGKRAGHAYPLALHRSFENMPSGFAGFYRQPMCGGQYLFQTNGDTGGIATVNREKDPKMKMAQDVLRHCFELSRSG